MALYTEESKERVRDAVDMADLVGTRTELRRAGVNRLQGLCPFHDERTPSFGIDPQSKLFYCFGCGEGGDAFRFVQLTEGLDFKGALEFLADRYGVQLDVAEEDARAAEQRHRRERLLEVLERTAGFYVRYLWESDEAAPAREYLAGRGLEEGILREFRVGYAPSAWDKVLLASRRAGFSDRELWEAGLAQRARGEGRTFDRFRRRIMFPLCDARGRVLGFGARAVGAGQQPKYLNSGEGPVYHKGRHLFGADLARVHATRAGTVVLAEGYTDVIALHQAGLRNTVGLMGTALTEEQVAELGRLAGVVVLALDADSAGQEAMLRAARVAAGRRLELRVARLPDGADPADLVQRGGAAAVASLIEESLPFVRFRVQRELDRGDLTTAEGKDRVIDALRPVFADERTLPPSVMREELLALVADRVDVVPALVASWLARGAAGAGARGAGTDAAAHGGRDRGAGGASGPATAEAGAGAVRRGRPALDAAARAERAFLAGCLALPAAGREHLAELDLDEDFTSDLTRRAAAWLRDREDDAAPPPAGDPELAALLAELAVTAAGSPPTTAALEADAIQLDLLRLERRIAAARAEATGAVAPLVARREELRRRYDAALARAMAESHPVGR